MVPAIQTARSARRLPLTNLSPHNVCANLVTHAWDLARATGLVEFEAIDPTEIETTYKCLAGLGDNMRQPGLFGPALEVPADANEQTRFLAFVGRKY
jgi:hypothetical protein